MIRPDQCQCLVKSTDLPCWPCYRDGFRQPNPNPPADESETIQREQLIEAEARAVAGGPE